MKTLLIILFISISSVVNAQVHVYVALCNVSCLPNDLGNGDNLTRNLYWGAGYGIKTYFNKDMDWVVLSDVYDHSDFVAERIIYKHTYSETKVVIDAYWGKYIENAIFDCLEDSVSSLCVYVGHNGLMDGISPNISLKNPKDIMLFSCFGKDYFEYYLRNINAYPVLWTTTTVAPEAYILDSALNDWINKVDNTVLRDNVVKVYAKYQRCGLDLANKTFITGW